MKKFLILFLGLALLSPTVITQKAEAYSSGTGVDPKNDDPGYGRTGLGDYETKVYVKSATAGASDAITAGNVLLYDETADDGYTLTRVGTSNSYGHQSKTACVALDDVATGDTAYHRCITKGFVRVQYDATTFPIEDGRQACVNTEGEVRGCDLSKPEATANTGIIPLEAKSSGAGLYLRAMVNMK